MLRYTGSNKKNKKLEWNRAPDIEKRVGILIKTLDLEWIKKEKVHCFRSKYSKTKAQARIWGLSRIFQLALDTKPAYVVEVISEKFDNLSKKQQDEILLHELAHIPKTFSGSLVPHYRKGKRKFNDKVNTLVARYKKSVKK